MDFKSYREQVKRELAAAVEPSANRPEETRELLSRRGGSVDARAKAIDATDIGGHDLDRLAGQYLETVADTREATTVRLRALDALRQAELLGPRFDPWRARLIDVLREVVRDPSPSLREEAAEVLAIHHDPVAQQLLLDGLKDTSVAVVPPDRAIQLLTYDDHGAAAATVREMYDTLDERAREAAIPLLASDPSSEELLTNLLMDKAGATEIRQLSASSLQALSPSAFGVLAQRIVSDASDYAEIRATCLAALAHDSTCAATVDPFFVEEVRQLRGTARSTNLKRAAERFLARREQ